MFDWDDTLLPSRWLEKKGMRVEYPSTITDEMAEACEEVAKSVIAVLTRAKQRGKVLIITNATDGWVQLSCQIFMPSVIPIMEGIPIIYAQEQYRKLSPSPLMWKHYAFFDQVDTTFKRPPPLRRNILIIGDGMPEQEAARAIKTFYSIKNDTQTVVKFIKMLDVPTPSCLIRQLNSAAESFEYIALHPVGLELMFNTG